MTTLTSTPDRSRLVRFVEWVRSWFCDHEMALTRRDKTLHLRCIKCGRATSGWTDTSGKVSTHAPISDRSLSPR